MAKQGNFWTIEGVDYRNERRTVDLLKETLDSGNEMNQTQWARYSRENKARSGFYTGDLPLHYATFEAIFDRRNKPQFKKTAEEVRNFLRENIRNPYPLTLTRILYTPSIYSDNLIVHNLGMKDEYAITARKLIDESNQRDFYNGLFGSSNIKIVNSVFKWINGTDFSIAESDLKSEIVKEAVTSFIADSFKTCLVCSTVLSYVDASFGLRLHEGRGKK